MIKELIILVSLSLGFLSLSGQDINVVQCYQNEVHSFRWLIDDNDAWRNGLMTGFLVERTNLLDGSKLIFEVRNETEKYLKLHEESEDERYTLAKLLTSNSETENFLLQHFDENELDLTNIVLARRNLSDYILNTNYQLILDSGFGFRDDQIDPEARYRYSITNLRPSLENSYAVDFSFDFIPASYEQPTLPNLESTWGNKRAELKWETKNYSSVFYGYELHRAMGEGEFVVIDTLLVNTMDTSSAEIFHSMYDRSFLENNDSLYTFRVYGRNYLGLRSINYSEITGKGNIGIGASPNIDQSELLNSNEVDLRWSIYPQFAENVKEWRIYVGENWDGPYEPDSTGIDPKTTELIRPLPYENNFFRLVAVDLNEVEHSSFPILVTHLDTIPPATPSNLQAKIDTNGIVDLTWDQNDEKDFYGYKLFFGFDTTREMTLANFKSFPESRFRDTIGLKSTNRDLYYKVTAVDDRNNRSPFSKIVKLLKPDILAPVSPNFYNYKSRPAGAFLAWHPSSSGDVIMQQLFRRDIDTETEWTLVNEWEFPNIDSTFTDKELVPTNTYAYFVMAMDSSGNYSNPSRPAVVKTLPKHDLDITLWNVSKLENTEVLISHEFDDTEIHSIHLFKKQVGKVPFEVAILDTERRTFEDDVIKKNITYSYFIKVIYKDGYETAYSEPKSIIYE